jgi:uridylate kinase
MIGLIKVSEIIVISVGGSLICRDDIDVDFLKKLKQIILKHVEHGKRFILITGGGRICRKYQEAAREVGEIDNEDLDWLGIHGTRINAHLIRTSILLIRLISRKKSWWLLAGSLALALIMTLCY